MAFITDAQEEIHCCTLFISKTVGIWKNLTVPLSSPSFLTLLTKFNGYFP